MDKKISVQSTPLKSGPWNLKLITEKVAVGDNELIIYRVKNLDDLVDQVTDDEFNKDERLPYWAELWPSAMALSRFLASNTNLLSQKKVIELGCGLGLTSLAAMMQQPEYLLCTDYEEAALKLTKMNFKLNRVRLPQLKLMDWRAPDCTNQFDVILASDILYEKRFFTPLLKLFRNLLTPDGMIILAEPNRTIARDFFLQLKECNYTFTVQFVEILQNDKKIVVSIYLIRKS